MILYSCSVEYAFNQRIFLGGNDMVSCENMIKDLKTLNLSNEKLEEVIKVAKKYV